MDMTLFCWFGQSHTNNKQRLQTKKTLTLDHKSMWPIAKVEMKTQLIYKNTPHTKDDSDVNDYFINPDL